MKEKILAKKGIIIGAVVIIAVLAAAFFWGGNNSAAEGSFDVENVLTSIETAAGEAVAEQQAAAEAAAAAEAQAKAEAEAEAKQAEANKMEIVNTEYNLKEEVEKLVKLIKPRIGEKPIELKYYIAPDIPGKLYGDKGKIKEIMTNILTNAAP